MISLVMVMVGMGVVENMSCAALEVRWRVFCIVEGDMIATLAGDLLVMFVTTSCVLDAMRWKQK